MQITGGDFKGFKLFTPPSQFKNIRPLRSRIRKSLFDTLENLLGGTFESCAVLDLFAGTGALGIEALSRRADFSLFVDASTLSIELIKKNLSKLGIPKEKFGLLKIIIPKDFKKLLNFCQDKTLTFDLIFITPPYESFLSLQTLEKLPLELLKQDSILVVEERSSLSLPDKIRFLKLFKTKIYGETALYFYQSLSSEKIYHLY